MNRLRAAAPTVASGAPARVAGMLARAFGRLDLSDRSRSRAFSPPAHLPGGSTPPFFATRLATDAGWRVVAAGTAVGEIAVWSIDRLVPPAVR
ncbi:MAG: hypothetical protein HY815_08930 [Candidatus Riflebacteria bacterium]|nr:hypothetical protein [Candidatus Riflebacteria bacterium]